jgi:hypothetical protein
MKLYNTYKNLILEIASIDTIVDSIKQKRRVIIYYDGDEPGGKGLRIVEPVCYGYSKAGNPVLRAWDVEGSSHRAYLGEKPLPSWRLFRVDKIINLRSTTERFNEMRPNYNPNGDKSMERVIINAVFDQGITPSIEGFINDVVSEVVTSMIENIRQTQGDGYLQRVDLSKAADAYKQVYQGLERKIGRSLSIEDKNNYRSQIGALLSQKQNDTINNL